jgi:small conductance mechanosensitive channel
MTLTFLQSLPSDLSATNINQTIDKLVDVSVSAGKHILAAVLIYIVGKFVIRVINHFVRRMLDRRNIDASVKGFLCSLVNILLMVLLIVSIIGALGVNTTSFAALLASAGVAVGMALSGNLQNFAGGLIILLFRPYRVGDSIEAQGVTGVVREIQIFHTILTTADNKVVYVPNGSLSTSTVVNYSREETRRIQWTVGVDYGEDVERVKKLLLGILAADARVLTDEGKAPFVALDTLGDSSVNIVVRVWVRSGDYWGVYHEDLQKIYETFNREGVNFPYPQQVVHLQKEA